MNNQKLFTKEEFNNYLDFFKAPEVINRDYVYEIYESVIEGIIALNQSQIFSINNINHFDVIQYILGEYLYSVAIRSPEEKEAFDKNETFQESMANVVADKYITLSQFNYTTKKMTNKYFPPVSTLSLYVNFILNILNNFAHDDSKSTVLYDLLNKAISITKCTIDLLTDGFETEAFSCWRTLHECECTLILLEKYGNPLIEKYLRHMTFGIAFKDIMEDKEKQNEIFYSMKEEMKEYNLKSKDIKKYIEYGWAYGIPGVKEDPTFKLNFRDGIEKLAGLSEYAKRYEMSSEIIHGTPILVYSNKEYFYYITLLSLYESFFRLEKVFASLFLANASEEIKQRYNQMQMIYHQQLVAIHQREAQMFKNWNTKKSKEKGN